MVEQFGKVGEDFQKMSKDGFDTAVRSFGDVNKSFQAITSEITDYSKKAFEELSAPSSNSLAQSRSHRPSRFNLSMPRPLTRLMWPRFRSWARCMSVWPRTPTSRSRLSLLTFRRIAPKRLDIFVRPRDPWLASGLFLIPKEFFRGGRGSTCAHPFVGTNSTRKEHDCPRADGSGVHSEPMRSRLVSHLDGRTRP